MSCGAYGDSSRPKVYDLLLQCDEFSCDGQPLPKCNCSIRLLHFHFYHPQMLFSPFCKAFQSRQHRTFDRAYDPPHIGMNIHKYA